MANRQWAKLTAEQRAVAREAGCRATATRDLCVMCYTKIRREQGKDKNTYKPKYEMRVRGPLKWHKVLELRDLIGWKREWATEPWPFDTEDEMENAS